MWKTLHWYFTLFLLGVCLLAGGYLFYFNRSPDNQRTGELIAELRGAYQEIAALESIAAARTQQLETEIGSLREAVESGARENRALRKHIQRLTEYHQAAEAEINGIAETNRRFRNLIEKIKAQAD